MSGKFSALSLYFLSLLIFPSRMPIGPVLSLLDPCCLPGFQHCISLSCILWPVSFLSFNSQILFAACLLFNQFNGRWELLNNCSFHCQVSWVFIFHGANFILMIWCSSCKDVIPSFYVFENHKQTPMLNSFSACSIISTAWVCILPLVRSADDLMAVDFLSPCVIFLYVKLPVMSIPWCHDGFMGLSAQSSKLYAYNWKQIS